MNEFKGKPAYAWNHAPAYLMTSEQMREVVSLCPAPDAEPDAYIGWGFSAHNTVPLYDVRNGVPIT